VTTSQTWPATEAAAVRASQKQILEDYIASMPVRVCDTTGTPQGLNIDGSGNVGLQGSLTLSPAVTLPTASPFTNVPLVHAAGDAQLAAVSAKRKTIQMLMVSVAGTGTAPTRLRCTIEEDLAGADTVIWTFDLSGFGLWPVPLPSAGSNSQRRTRRLTSKNGSRRQ
jgi:hypothetical protein